MSMLLTYYYYCYYLPDDPPEPSADLLPRLTPDQILACASERDRVEFQDEGARAVGEYVDKVDVDAVGADVEGGACWWVFSNSFF
jgi:hypothetical protein